MTVIYFIILLGVVIVVHELGHLVFAKIFHVYVREFAVGFGPRLLSHKSKETVYSLRAIPLGGFTAMASEANDMIEGQSETDEPIPADLPQERTLNGIKAWKRIIILVGGPLFNVLLAVGIFIAMITINGGMNQAPKAIVGEVMAGSAAEQAGLQAGDLIVEIDYSDGTSIKPQTFSDMVEYNSQNHDTAVYTIQRGSQTLTFEITPVYNETAGAYQIGIKSTDYEFIEMNFWQAIPAGIDYCWQVVVLTFTAIIKLFRGIGLDSLSGTIGIYKTTETAVSYGFVTYLSLMGCLSVNLGLMNLIPVPMFDGGRILITVVEKIIGHRLSPKVENGLMVASLILIAVLFIYVSYNDIIKLL